MHFTTKDLLHIVPFLHIFEGELLLSWSSINVFFFTKDNSRTSLNILEHELCCLRMKQDQMLKRINDKRY
jgi:hypothetical protein